MPDSVGQDEADGSAVNVQAQLADRITELEAPKVQTILIYSAVLIETHL